MLFWAPSTSGQTTKCFLDLFRYLYSKSAVIKNSLLCVLSSVPVATVTLLGQSLIGQLMA